MAEAFYPERRYRAGGKFHVRISGFVLLPLAAIASVSWLVGRVFLCWGHVAPETVAMCRNTGRVPVGLIALGAATAVLCLIELLRGGLAFVDALGAALETAERRQRVERLLSVPPEPEKRGTRHDCR